MYNTSGTSVGWHCRIMLYSCCLITKLQSVQKITPIEKDVHYAELQATGRWKRRWKKEWTMDIHASQNEKITKIQSVQKITLRARDVHCAELQAMVGWKRQRKKKWTKDIRESQTKYAHNRAEQVLWSDGEIGEKKIEDYLWQCLLKSLWHLSSEKT